jgi:outer membrane protein with beta-barrel domain
MNVGFRRFALGALTLVGLFLATANDASAQSAPRVSWPALETGIKFDVPSSTGGTSFAAPAQPSSGGGIGFGVVGGVTRAKLTGDEIEDAFESKNGLMAGVWVGGNRNGRVGFTGEFLYVWRKADTLLGELKFPALEIPAVVHVNFGDTQSVFGYALFGPVFTINLKQELEGEDVSDDFNGADIGLMAGGGVEFYRVAIELRGNWGMRNISNEGDVGDIKTRAVEFVVKYRIN